jgi:hypothetical protein
VRSAIVAASVDEIINCDTAIEFPDYAANAAVSDDGANIIYAAPECFTVNSIDAASDSIAVSSVDVAKIIGSSR